MAEADIARLKAIGRQICQWHFDDRLGLSAAEMLRLSTVPWIAGSHHEKLDGTGYPRRLKAPELTLADRVMTLADIFEALTATDRPTSHPRRCPSRSRSWPTWCASGTSMPRSSASS